MNLKGIQGFLFDLDGVFYVGDELIPGGIETLNYLTSKCIPYRFITNTTTKSRFQICKKLARWGIPIEESQIFSAVYAGVLKLRKWGNPSCFYFLKNEAKMEFDEFTENSINPDVIVIGDLDQEWTFENMNRAFNYVMNGSKILALHKGKYFQVDEGLQIDSGAFVHAIEFATSKSADVVGKPNENFFKLAIQDMGINNVSHIAMIGDDLINDIEGAQKVGIKSGLVKTGKFRKEILNQSNVKPDFILSSISELPNLF